MSVYDEFSRHAHAYGECNRIQVDVARKLLALRGDHPLRVLDLGCGSGTLYRLMDWKLEQFVGIDFSAAMLALHPQGDEVELHLANFNDSLVWNNLQKESFDRIYSASALQWAEDLDHLFRQLAQLHTPLSLAIFTSGTFKTLHQIAKVSPLLRSSEEVIALAQRYWKSECEIMTTTLPFGSVREMLRYIKRSGVSGSRNVLSVGQIKQLMENYPLAYLEFEVLFIHT